MFSLFLIAYIFWEKRMFFRFLFWTTSFFSLLTNLFSSFTFFSSCFAPLVCLRPFFFFWKLQFFISHFLFPFFSLISSFFFFEHRSFLVPFFLPSGYKCSWFLLVFELFWSLFASPIFSASLTKKKNLRFWSVSSFFAVPLKINSWFSKMFLIFNCVSHFFRIQFLYLLFFYFFCVWKNIFFFERFFGWSFFFSVSWLFFFSSFNHSRFFVSFFVNLPFWSLRYFVTKNTCVVFVTLYFSIFSFILLSSLFFCFHLFKSLFCCFFFLPFSFPSGKHFLVPIFFTVLSDLLSFLLFSFFLLYLLFSLSLVFSLVLSIFVSFFFFLSFVSPIFFSLLFSCFFFFFSFLSLCLFFSLSLVFWISFFFFWSFLYLVFSWPLLFLI